MLKVTSRTALSTLLIVIMAGLATPALAADYFVSPAGDDGQPGTESQPWQTIQHAADTVLPGDRVTVRAGTYDEAGNGEELPLVLTGESLRGVDGPEVTIIEGVIMVGVVMLGTAASMRGAKQ